MDSIILLHAFKETIKTLDKDAYDNTTLNYIIDEVFNQYSQKALIELNQFNEIMAPENLKKFI
jgi:hypothetical protein